MSLAMRARSFSMARSRSSLFQAAAHRSAFDVTGNGGDGHKSRNTFKAKNHFVSQK
jgi:hypothetical protein